MPHSPTPLPPQWPVRVLRWYCNPELVEEIQGDLYEAFQDNLARRGRWQAKLMYVWDALTFLRPSVRESRNTYAFPASRIALVKNYGRLSVRYLAKHQGFFALDVLGLAIGIAACLIILHHVRFELGYDAFHRHADRIYRVSATLHTPEHDEHLAPTICGLAPALQERFPEVETAVRLNPTFGLVENEAGDRFNENYFYQADPTVFRVFTYPLLAGDPATALTEPHSVVLTLSLARKYFGDTPPASLLGTLLTVNREVHTITGIMQDPPANSDLRADAFLSWQYHPDEWLEVMSYTYLLLEDAASADALAAQLPAFDRDVVTPRVAQDWGSLDATLSHHLLPLTDLHYTTHLLGDTEEKGNKAYVYIFLLAALGILLVAAINYVNLSVAQATRRTVEVGICQALGAGKFQLWRQYMSECLLTTLSAVLLSLGLVLLIGHRFAELLGEPITWPTLAHPDTVYILLGILLAISFLAGSYPAFYLSSLHPVRALKGSSLLHAGEGRPHRGRFRKALIVVQFVVAIGMVAGTLVVRDQVRYMQHKDLGFRQKQMVSMVIPDDSVARKKALLLKHALQQDARIAQATTGSRPDALWSLSSFSVASHGGTRPMSAKGIPVDEDYLEVLRIPLVAGRNFAPSASRQIIVNEAFVREAGWNEPIGQEVAFSESDVKEVVGVVRDFHYAPLHEKIKPFILYYDTSTPINLIVPLAPQDMEVVQAIWLNFFPDVPLEYEFLDDAFHRRYRTEMRMLTLFNYFSGLSLFVACMGLLGLTATLAQQKTKEIGIRKVLGAGRGAILYLLSREFGILWLLAALVATPVAYVAMRFWLQNFAYQTSVRALVFLLAGGGVGLLALLTLSYHTLKAAATNPADSLRHE